VLSSLHDQATGTISEAIMTEQPRATPTNGRELLPEELETISGGFCGFYLPPTTQTAKAPPQSDLVVTKSTDRS
jgi:hypothetical protein